MFQGTASVGRNPECAELPATEEALTHAIVDEMGEVAPANVKCFTGSVAFGLSLVGMVPCIGTGINLKDVVFQFRESLSPAPLGRRSLVAGHVDPLHVFALHEGQGCHYFGPVTPPGDFFGSDLGDEEWRIAC
jgi:hypothetical protein